MIISCCWPNRFSHFVSWIKPLLFSFNDCVSNIWLCKLYLCYAEQYSWRHSVNENVHHVSHISITHNQQFGILGIIKNQKKTWQTHTISYTISVPHKRPNMMTKWDKTRIDSIRPIQTCQTLSVYHFKVSKVFDLHWELISFCCQDREIDTFRKFINVVYWMICILSL